MPIKHAVNIKWYSWVKLSVLIVRFTTVSISILLKLCDQILLLSIKSIEIKALEEKPPFLNVGGGDAVWKEGKKTIDSLKLSPKRIIVFAIKLT